MQNSALWKPQIRKSLFWNFNSLNPKRIVPFSSCFFKTKSCRHLGSFGWTPYCLRSPFLHLFHENLSCPSWPLHLTRASSAPGHQPGAPYFELSQVSLMLVLWHPWNDQHWWPSDEICTMRPGHSGVLPCCSWSSRTSLLLLRSPAISLGFTILLLLLQHSPAVSLGFTILGEIFAYVTLFLIQPLR